MCRGKNDPGGPRRCDRHLKELTAEQLLPERRDDTPELRWAGEEPTDIYKKFPKQVANAALTALLNACEHEKTMTTQLLAAIGTKAKMPGLEERLKSPSSLARKIATKAIERMMTPKDAADSLDDILRYTVTTRRLADLVPTMSSAIDTLTAQGWSVHSAEHSFVRGNPYKGIHLVLVGPGGHRCEVQFHTESALAIKNEGHADYEIYRDIDLPDETRKAAFNRSASLWDTVPTPTGLSKVRSLAGVTMIVKKYTFTPIQRPREDQ